MRRATVAIVSAVACVVAVGEALRAEDEAPPAWHAAVTGVVADLVPPWELPESDPRHVGEALARVELGDPLAAAWDAVAGLRGEPDPLAGRAGDAAEAGLWARLFAVPLLDDPAAFGAWRAGARGGEAAADALAARLESIASVEAAAWARAGDRPSSFRVAIWTGKPEAAFADTDVAEDAVDELEPALAAAARRALDGAVVAASAPLEDAFVRLRQDPYADPAEVEALVDRLAALARSRARVRFGRVEAGDAAHVVAIDLAIGDRRVTRVRAQMRRGATIVTVDAEADGDDGLEDDVVAILRSLAAR